MNFVKLFFSLLMSASLVYILDTLLRIKEIKKDERMKKIAIRYNSMAIFDIVFVIVFYLRGMKVPLDDKIFLADFVYVSVALYVAVKLVEHNINRLRTEYAMAEKKLEEGADDIIGLYSGINIRRIGSIAILAAVGGFFIVGYHYFDAFIKNLLSGG